MSSSRYPGGLRVVVLGVLGQSPFAGVAWQVMHYLEGLRRLGADVFYLEDTGEWPYDPVANTVTNDPRFTVEYIDRTLRGIGMDGRWAYRSAPQNGRIYGADGAELYRFLGNADVLINLTGATVLDERHMSVPIRIYLETDPVLPEIEIANGRRSTAEHFAQHTHIATFGENLGAPDCPVPVPDFTYVKTRQPVVVDWWQDGADPAPEAPYTSVASWKQTSKDVDWQGERYTWTKHTEFQKVIDLPSQVARDFLLALACDDKDAVLRLNTSGWKVIDAHVVSSQPQDYRRFIQSSFGEFTVAKDQYARLRSGWFSDRTASYLAAGRPVVTQDTGFGCTLPIGKGLCAFTSVEEARAAIEVVESDPEGHARAATAIAREYFEATRVLRDLLSAVGAGG